MDRALALAPDDYWVAVDRGTLLMGMGRRKDALAEFERAKTLSPDEFLAYVYSAGIKDENKDYAGAEADYAAVCRLRPDYYFAFEGLGLLKMKRGDYAGARDAFAGAYKGAPSESSYALLAAVNWMKAEGPAAPRQFLDQAMRKLNRDSLEYRMMRLYFDLASRVYSGEMEVVTRVERETNPQVKSRMYFYLANYYEIRKMDGTAKGCYLKAKALGFQSTPEWRLTSWAVEKGNLK